MSVPKVSFVLGIRNAERTLRECLSSIYRQDFPEKDYELIIVDGGSTDSTLDIIKDFQKSHKNIRLYNNPHKLSEGKGMSKDMGVQRSKGEIIIFLDDDNIIIEREWLNQMLIPFSDKEIMASQSQLGYHKGDTMFLKYVNGLGVEDPFATPCSLVSQITLHPEDFEIIDGKYYYFKLDKKNILFGGANGCAFRKSVFAKIGGYTRDVDVFASMAEYNMAVAVPLNGRIHHKTSSNLWGFLKKKGIYFFRFINNDYKIKKFRWVPKDFNGQIRFALTICYNLSIIGPSLVAFKQLFKTGEVFWLLHPFYLFYVTLEYGLITLTKIKNFFTYVR